ncbi:unnamed protein product [Coffea canephora]|uniref:RING-type domain-containing protein n=1 Tax=Coffea canephora TaxID=49390 RepID=A0A068UJS8_COFCA|nr:unnamed protein product [Coffea canephora]
MGFPVGYTEVFLPKIFIQALSILGFIRSVLFSIFRFLGLSDFLEPAEGYYFQENPAQMPLTPPISAILIRELLPVVKFSDLVAGAGGEPPEKSCAVCLSEFEGGEEIRWLKNCKHIFHRSCLDRWMDHDQKTCPLCRTPFVPRDLEDEFNQRLWAASSAFGSSSTHDFYDDDYGDTPTTIPAL